MDFINTLKIHRHYGVVDLPVEFIDIQSSSRKNQKYMITVKHQGVTKTIHYGDKRYQQYEDRTPDDEYFILNHHDLKRRNSYLARASRIRNKNGDLTCNDPFSANRYSIITLW